MSRRDRERLDDVLVAISVIRVHMERGISMTAWCDAVRVRLIEIGEAVKMLSGGLREVGPA